MAESAIVIGAIKAQHFWVRFFSSLHLLEVKEEERLSKTFKHPKAVSIFGLDNSVQNSPLPEGCCGWVAQLHVCPF